MTPRRTNQPLDLEVREDLEREVYSSTRDQGTLAEMRDGAAAAYAQAVSKLKHPSVVHNDNQDETKYKDQGFMGSFSKGLPRQSGAAAGTECLPRPDEFLRFRRAIHTANFFEGPDVPQLGRDQGTPWRVATDDLDMHGKPKVGLRGWEAPESGLSFEPHGPDSHSVTMAAAPSLDSTHTQLIFEMAEVYWLSLLRDIPLTEFSASPTGITKDECGREVSAHGKVGVDAAVADLNAMAYAANGFRDPDGEAAGIPSRRRQVGKDGALTAATVFRGITPGDAHGPYVSQFLLMGSPNPADEKDAANINIIKRGNIGYGAQVISQKLRPHLPCLDHMTDRASYLDVQEGAKVNGNARFDDIPRFLKTPRDLATYVHYDALYQAYLNACLMLLGFGAPVDPGIAAHHNMDKLTTDLRNPTEGFALFGGPHILNLVTEVATRGLKAVRYQKFNVHCRLRPEAVAGIIEFDPYNLGGALAAHLSSELKDHVKAWNEAQNSSGTFGERTLLDAAKLVTEGSIDQKTLLLPMAFPEGSPMHPAYGAGHATVAGACVTMLKAFFDTDAVIVKDAKKGEPVKVAIIPRSVYESDTTRYRPLAFVPNETGMQLKEQAPGGDGPLTVGGELNKLAANIAIARNMAGVHFYTDYIDSLTMGEEVAIRTLEESMSAFQQYPNSVRPSMSIPKFLGGFERIAP